MDSMFTVVQGVRRESDGNVTTHSDSRKMGQPYIHPELTYLVQHQIYMFTYSTVIFFAFFLYKVFLIKLRFIVRTRISVRVCMFAGVSNENTLVNNQCSLGKIR